MRFFIFVFFAVFALACKPEKPVNRPQVNNNTVVNTNKPDNSLPTSSTRTSGEVPVYGYEIVNTYKHDSKAFTEGLFFHDGFFYESAGQLGRSSLRKVEMDSGKVVQQYNLPNESFGEGISLFNGNIYQLTWQEERGFVFDANDFKPLREFDYKGEGWGLTTDGKQLIMSDGTHVIRYVDPETFQTQRTITVFQEDGKPLMNINELEYIKGEIWSNVWHSETIGKPNYIARIDPQTGRLLGWIDLGGISPDDVDRDPENTMNGIAYDEAKDRIFVTGKNWKKLFEIKVKPKS
ncbi:MAG: glutaminyl-peptide cyclotransferase [Pyrinomonadaceae bacterium]